MRKYEIEKIYDFNSIFVFHYTKYYVHFIPFEYVYETFQPYT